MLGRHWRFRIVNNTGATIQFSADDANNTFTIDGRSYLIDPSTGKISWESSEQTVFADPTSDLSDGASLAGATQDNSSDGYTGFKGIATLLTDAAVDGQIDIYLEESTDGGSTWPSDAADFQADEDLIHVAALFCDTNDDRSVNLEIAP